MYCYEFLCTLGMPLGNKNKDTVLLCLNQTFLLNLNYMILRKYYVIIEILLYRSDFFWLRDGVFLNPLLYIIDG